jgi:hypothetical protein
LTVRVYRPRTACIGLYFEHVLKRFRKALASDPLVDDEHRFIGQRVEILLHRDDFAAEQQAEAGGVEVAAFEGFGAEMMPEGMQEGGVDTCGAAP